MAIHTVPQVTAGDMQISTTEAKVISHTPMADTKQTAQQLYATHCNAIEAAFS